jgi:hypothetical protein
MEITYAAKSIKFGSSEEVVGLAALLVWPPVIGVSFFAGIRRWYHGA